MEPPVKRPPGQHHGDLRNALQRAALELVAAAGPRGFTMAEASVAFVLSNSVDPEAFPVDYDYSFDLTTRELTMSVVLPEPCAVSGA